jgi:signal transduction histidine kinase
MHTRPWEFLKRLAGLLVTPATDPAHQAERIRFMERNIGLAVKVVLVVILYYNLFLSNWTQGLYGVGELTFDTVRRFFQAWTLVNILAAATFIYMDRLPLSLVQWVTGVNNVVDGLFLGAMVIATGGTESTLYWVFLGLIVRNAVSMPIALAQLSVNLMATASYALAGPLYKFILSLTASNSVTSEAASTLNRHLTNAVRDDTLNPLLTDESPTAPGFVMANQINELFIARICLLLFLTACCYGLQVLLDRQREAEEEAREFAGRQEQLQAAGRLAAEIAHQIKNPLGIINNAAFNLQRALQEGRTDTGQQITIIREEVERADRIITELMGYAQLAEGKVERLNAADEINYALLQVFPAGAKYQVAVQRSFAPALPSLLMQRGHFQEVLVNVLQNAREAMEGRGNIQVGTRYGENYSVVVTITDDGPGIAPDTLNRIFEPYFTTKKKGTGLGLAIVKHNVELYGGTVRAESLLGHGTTFVLQFPGKAIMSIRK